ncbi:ATP-binding cassette domain-containing protein [Fusibacter paucivorans]|uniref:ATP-binding cassette domain-containing protein n=1 Tax=Fusibacter paucivorans TaxID=76009 RepID=A0ABS5PP30_9FIRM|nr:ATP-binding cassette domain-containing protein [Fusibacter paucivorans]MBS7526934.1 ATP-binding cassette domain-containing protein [Fusibacter paucivorans]
MNKIELVNIAKAYEKGTPVIEHLNLNIKEGSFTVLVGPSGCGKSTILRIIAGLEKETSGDVLIEGKNVSDIAPGDRQIAMVFQNYALYPTMTVRENIEFGLKNIKMPKAERQAKIAEISKLVDLEPYLSRKPHQLSGGQRQRVALARAIVKNPSVFLMDEPLSNLDAKLRSQIRTDLIELYRKLKTTFVYVTHDQVEAMSMATDIILLDKGKIQHRGSPADIYENPSNVFTARFIGSPPMNILSVEAIDLEDRMDKESDLIGKEPISISSIGPHHARYVGFRPEHSRIAKRCPEMNDLSINELFLEGIVQSREMLGDHVLYKVKTKYGEVYVKSFQLNMVDYGACHVVLNPKDLMFFDGNQNRIETDEERCYT